MTATEIPKYSQREEQGAILGYFEGRAPGRFLDVGAWDPKTFSNTRALFELGWSGVMVEPSPGPLANLLREYGGEPRIQLVAAAVGLEPGLVAMHISDDGLSTASEQNFELWKTAGGFKGQVHVNQICLPQLLIRFGGFQFVSIDTEGSSVDLFMQLLRLGHRPDCVCVEHDGRHGECGIAAQTAGYRQLYLSTENLVYGR